MPASFPPDTVFTRNPRLQAVELDGDTVMMDSESGRYFALKGVGGFVWEALEKSISIEDVISAIENQFDISAPGNVQDEVEGFLVQMIENGLVYVGPAS